MIINTQIHSWNKTDQVFFFFRLKWFLKTIFFNWPLLTQSGRTHPELKESGGEITQSERNNVVLKSAFNLLLYYASILLFSYQCHSDYLSLFITIYSSFYSFVIFDTLRRRTRRLISWFIMDLRIWCPKKVCFFLCIVYCLLYCQILE